MTWKQWMVAAKNPTNGTDSNRNRNIWYLSLSWSPSNIQELQYGALKTRKKTWEYGLAGFLHYIIENQTWTLSKTGLQKSSSFQSIGKHYQARILKYIMFWGWH